MVKGSKMHKSRSLPRMRVAKQVTTAAGADRDGAALMGTFLTGVELESPIQRRPGALSVPEIEPLDTTMEALTAPTPAKKTLLLSGSLSIPSFSSGFIDPLAADFVDPLERLWLDHRSSTLLRTMADPAADPTPVKVPTTKPAKRKKKRKKKRKRAKKSTITTHNPLRTLNRAETVVSALRRRKKTGALYDSSGNLSAGARTAPTILGRPAKKSASLRQPLIHGFESRQQEDAQRRFETRNEAAQSSILHIRKMRAWEREMRFKRVRNQWFKESFFPAAERIQVTLRRNHAFLIWKEDMLTLRAQGERLTLSLERLTTFKAFRTWKLDMLFLRCIEHGAFALQDITTRHKWRKFFAIWKVYFEDMRTKWAARSAALAADDSPQARRKYAAGAFDGVSRAMLKASMRNALRDWRVWVTYGLPERRRQQRHIKFWNILGKCVRTAGTWKSFEKWLRACGLKALTKPTLRVKPPQQKGRSSSPKLLITELDKINCRVRARIDAGEESRLRMLAREIMQSKNEFHTDKDADRITLNIDMPSGGSAILSQIPTTFKVDDIMMALSTLQRKEVKMPRKAVASGARPYGITIIFSGKPLRKYKLRSGPTLFALVRLLGGRSPDQGTKTITAMDWVEGADLYQAKWKHTKGAKICRDHRHDHNKDDAEHEHDRNARFWEIDDEGNHVYERARAGVGREAPPVVFKVRVVHYHDELRVLYDAVVDLVNVQTNKVINLGKGLVRSTVLEESGEYMVVAKMKAHVQRDYLQKFNIDRHGRKPSEWEEPITLLVHLEFMPSIRLSIREGPLRSDDAPQSDSPRSEIDVEQTSDLSAACVEMKASDGSLVELKRDFGAGGFIFVGQPTVPNSYYFSVTLANFQQETLRTPMHFSFESWLADCDENGVIGLKCVIALQPNIVVECLLHGDDEIVLPDADVDLVALPPPGSYHKPIVQNLGKGIARFTQVECTRTYSVIARLENFEQSNYKDNFTLPSKSWPSDGPLRITVRMRFKPFLKLSVIDVDTGETLKSASLTITESTRQKSFTIDKTRWDMHGKIQIPADCPAHYVFEGSYLNYQQTKPITLHAQQTNYPKSGIKELVIPMRFVDPAKDLFSSGLGKDTIDPCFILDVSGSTSNGFMLDKVKNAMSVVLGGRYNLRSVNVVAFSTTSRSWRLKMATASTANLRDAAIFVEKLRPLYGSNFSKAFDLAARCGRGSDRVYFISCGEPAEEGALAVALAMSHKLGGIPVDTTSAHGSSAASIELLKSISHRSGGLYRHWDYTQSQR